MIRHWTAFQLQEKIKSWPGVRVLVSQERGLRFCTCKGEFLHFHGEMQVDIRLSLEDRDRAIRNGEARFHPRAHEGGWVILRLDGPEAAHVLRLAAAAYRYSLRDRGRKQIVQ